MGVLLEEGLFLRLVLCLLLAAAEDVHNAIGHIRAADHHTDPHDNQSHDEEDDPLQPRREGLRHVFDDGNEWPGDGDDDDHQDAAAAAHDLAELGRPDERFLRE